MAKSISVLFVSSEAYPFAKVGGIADVTYSLPLALRDLGHDVRVMIPKYGVTSERKNRIHEINRLRDIPIPMGSRSEPVTVKSSSMNNPRQKVQAYIATNDRYFNSKKGIYHDPRTWKEYADNDERFIFFNRTVIETCLLLGWFPDVIHCNDWQTALIPAYVKAMFPEEFKDTKVVFTIHNFYYQGDFEGMDFSLTGLPKEAQKKFKTKNGYNFMKGALYYADYITTVSNSYAEEILADKKLTNGLNSKLKERAKDFKGILNGIDPWAWNPKNDSFIKSKLNSDLEEYKYDNKVELSIEFGFEFKPRTPIIGMITRFDEQKGIDLVIDSIDDLMELDIQLVILGEGTSDHKKELRRLARKYSDKIKVKFEIDDRLAHQIEAGADMFLMPSKFEPCGLNLMYSLLYGTIPIIRYTGGLKDIAKPYDPKTKTGNSFVFDKANSKELVDAVKKAVEVYQDEEEWEQLVRNGMRNDFSWDDSAKQYEEIYKKVLNS